MHGISVGSAFHVNAEVDSMGGVIDGGAGVDSNTSPHQMEIERAQAELRQEFDVREERRRELEFLEKGGNPLDFRVGPATSISVQSTSVTDQQAEHEGKGSFALTASPHADSVDSSAKPIGKEPTTADNLLLFDGEKDALYGDRNAIYSGKRIDISQSEQSSRRVRGDNMLESEDLALFRLGARGQAAYARRHRSRTNRDNAHSCSTNFTSSAHDIRSSILPSSRHNLKDGKGFESRVDKDLTISSDKKTSPRSNAITSTVLFDGRMDMDIGKGSTYQNHASRVDATEVGMEGGPEIKEKDCNELAQMGLEHSNNLLSFVSPVSVGEGVLGTSPGSLSVPTASTEKKESFTTAVQIDVFGPEMEGNMSKNEGNCSYSAAVTVSEENGLDNGSIGKNIANNPFAHSSKISNDLNGNAKQAEATEVASSTPALDTFEETNMSKSTDLQGATSVTLTPDLEEHAMSTILVKTEQENCNSRSASLHEVKPNIIIDGVKHVPVGNDSNFRKAGVCPENGMSCTTISKNFEPLKAVKGSVTGTDFGNSIDSQLLLPDNEHEHSKMEESQIMEASRRRIIEHLSLTNTSIQKCQKSHWDFVLEEMPWLANDFMQERVWKMTAAAKISQYVSSNGLLKFNCVNLHRKQKKVAHTLSKAVLQFWNSIEAFQDIEEQSNGTHEANSALFVFWKNKGVESAAKENSNSMEEKNSKSCLQLPISKYAIRFLKYSKSADCSIQAEAPMTPDLKSDAGIFQSSWEEQYSESNLFYSVPVGAMGEYRNSVESYCAHYEKLGNTMQREEYDMSLFDPLLDEEDEGETGFGCGAASMEFSKPPKLNRKTKKGLQKLCPSRSYQPGSDLSYGHYIESKMGSQTSLLIGERSSGSLNVGSIPTKRVRTAARQRIAGPFGSGIPSSGQMFTKADTSSGDTGSFHDDLISVHGGSQPKKVLEVESTEDSFRQFPFDSSEISKKAKRKKAKYFGFRKKLSSAGIVGLGYSVKGSSTYEQRWLPDFVAQHDERDHSRKRLESQLDSNENTGMHGHHAAKKPKGLRQFSEASLENVNPLSGLIPSPVASQMSNMSNSSKLNKVIANRDRGRKSKSNKVPSGISGSGSPWSIYEDQALVVLVHDLGPNWELVSDAMNSILQVKCFFRKPKECKERHKELMDRNAGDGADSAEDSGSSQPYPSTLPGIPKGSARQLFQRLLGPMEEDTLKDHFEKIVRIGQHSYSNRPQSSDQEMKLETNVHSSHEVALSRICPSNSNGTLTPLDLCDAAASSPDVSSQGYQGLHGGLAVTNSGSVAPVPSASGTYPMLQGSSGMVIGNNLSSPSATMNGHPGDVPKIGMQRMSSFPADKRHRIHPYQIPSGRSIQHPSAVISSAMHMVADRGTRMHPAANEMGIMCGMNRGIPMSRPGFQGMGSPSMINMGNPSNVLPSTGVKMASTVNITNGAVAGQGNSILRPREAIQRLPSGQNPDEQRQMMQELQKQVSNGSGSGGIPFSGLSKAFPNQTSHSTVQTFAVQHQQQHIPQQSHVLTSPLHPHLQSSSCSPQQAYAIHMSKESIQKQRFLQQQHLTAPNSSMPQSQLQFQHNVSSGPIDSHIQQQSSTQSVPLPPQNLQMNSTSSPMNPTMQSQQKHHHGPQGLGRIPQSSGSLPNQMTKQRPCQQPQPPPKHRQQQRQQLQQHAKLMKGIQVPEKGEQPVMHLMQGQGAFPGLGRNSVPLGKQMGPQPSNQVQQQVFSCPLQPVKQPQVSSHLDTHTHCQVQVPSSHGLQSSQQHVPSPLVMAPQQQQQMNRQSSQPQQIVQRVLQKNLKANSDVPIQASAGLNNAAYSTASQQWKEPLYDAKNVSPTYLSSMGNSHQLNVPGAEPNSSSQRLGSQGHFSGSIPIHGHNAVGQRQQQLHQLPQQQQHQGQGQSSSLHPHTSVSGPG